MIQWIITFFVLLVYPCLYPLCNPLLFFVSRSICQKKLSNTLWLSLGNGLVKDILLASPKFGLLGLSSLISARIAFYYASIVTVEGLSGLIQITAIIAFLDTFLASLFCHFMHTATTTLFSIKFFFLNVVFAAVWTAFLHATTLVSLLSRKRRRS